MSNVTNIVILVPLSLSLELEAVNALTAESLFNAGELKEIDDYAGGNKRMEHTIWAGAFNGLDLDAFLAALSGWAVGVSENFNASAIEGLDVLIIGQHDTSASFYRVNRTTGRLELVHPGEKA